MAKLHTDKTLEKLKSIVKKDFDNRSNKIIEIKTDITNGKRSYLGMSEIGDPCSRKLWYNFRWCGNQEFEADTILKFQAGHIAESVAICYLNRIPGIKLVTHDNQNNQFAFSDIDGHFSGHMDGVIKDLVQNPDKWFIWEHKDTEKINKIINLKNKEEPEVLKKWNENYYGQAQCYMGYSKVHNHWLTCSFGIVRKFEAVETTFNKEYFEKLKEKARNIIYKDLSFFTKENLSKEKYPCTFCHHSGLCHGTEVPEINCRTCVSSEPCENGNWKCDRDKKIITNQNGCSKHLFHPDLLKNFGDCIETNENIDWIKYITEKGKIFYNTNCDHDKIILNDNWLGFFTSKQIKNLKENIFNITGRVVNCFNGEIKKDATEWIFCKAPIKKENISKVINELKKKKRKPKKRKEKIKEEVGLWN